MPWPKPTPSTIDVNADPIIAMHAREAVERLAQATPPRPAGQRIPIPRVGDRPAPAKAAVAPAAPPPRAQKTRAPRTPAPSDSTRETGAQRARPSEPRFRRRDTPRAGDVVRFRGESGAYRLTPITDRKASK